MRAKMSGLSTTLMTDDSEFQRAVREATHRELQVIFGKANCVECPKKDVRLTELITELKELQDNFDISEVECEAKISDFAVKVQKLEEENSLLEVAYDLERKTVDELSAKLESMSIELDDYTTFKAFMENAYTGLGNQLSSITAFIRQYRTKADVVKVCVANQTESNNLFSPPFEMSPPFDMLNGSFQFNPNLAFDDMSVGFFTQPRVDNQVEKRSHESEPTPSTVHKKSRLALSTSKGPSTRHRGTATRTKADKRFTRIFTLSLDIEGEDPNNEDLIELTNPNRIASRKYNSKSVAIIPGFSKRVAWLGVEDLEYRIESLVNEVPEQVFWLRENLATLGALPERERQERFLAYQRFSYYGKQRSDGKLYFRWFIGVSCACPICGVILCMNQYDKHRINKHMTPRRKFHTYAGNEIPLNFEIVFK